MSQAFAAAGTILAKQAVKPATSIPAPRNVTGPTSTTDFFTMCGTAGDVQSTSTSATYADVINVSGAGVLLFCALYGTSTGSAEPEITITVDGTNALNAYAATYGNIACPVGAMSAIDTGGVKANVALDAVYFTTSCRVQLRRKSGSGTVVCAVKYRMT